MIIRRIEYMHEIIKLKFDIYNFTLELLGQYYCGVSPTVVSVVVSVLQSLASKYSILVTSSCKYLELRSSCKIPYTILNQDIR